MFEIELTDKGSRSGTQNMLIHPAPGPSQQSGGSIPLTETLRAASQKARSRADYDEASRLDKELAQELAAQARDRKAAELEQSKRTAPVPIPSSSGSQRYSVGNRSGWSVTGGTQQALHDRSQKELGKSLAASEKLSEDDRTHF